MIEGTILLVEDNPDDVLLTLRALRKHNMVNEVVVARDGKEALDYLYGGESSAGRDTSTMPVLVLLDLKLPRVNGLEVLRHIRTHPQTKLLPVVVLTTSDEEQDLVDCYTVGCNSYVRKPVEFAAFMEAVRQLGLYWLVLNAPAPARGR